MKDDQYDMTEEILERMKKVQRHVPSAKIREHPAFAALYSMLDEPHRFQVDKALRDRENG